ncbi:MAG TPA: hypothetical protein VMM18_00070 [Gemmatimonadaceae bacterium]|nr:hypothetical protein [Gemmatimonadaceae bacterium]
MLRSLAATALVFAAGCTYPTDQSIGMYVSVAAPGPVLIRGTVADLEASVWIRGDAGDSIEVHNAELIWSTSDPSLATIASGGAGVGRVTGVNPGMVEIRAIAPGYESAEPGLFHLRVANPLEIDSISPDTVRYGQLLLAYGVGVGQLFFAGLGNATLNIDSLAFSGDPAGLGVRAFWVAYPASTGFLLGAGAGQLVSSPDSTVVLPFDIYEPNQTAPAVIQLDGAPPYPELPIVRFFNPALAFEDLRGAPFGYDWYRWTTADPSKPYTFIFVGPSLKGTHGSYLTDDASTVGPDSWRLGPGQYDCKGYEFRPPVAPTDSLYVALGRLPAGSVDLISVYTQQGRYALGVLQAYEPAFRQIPPDRFEENDLCGFADENFANPTTRIDLTNAFAENLTMDTPHGIDWLRFRVPGTVAQPVTVRTVPHTFGKADRTDLDTYVLRVPGATGGLDILGGNVDPGSTSSTTILLAPGDYYLAVVDSAGVPTHYGVCIAIGSTCTLPPAPAPPSTTLEPSAVSLPMRLGTTPDAGAAMRARAGFERPWR